MRDHTNGPLPVNAMALMAIADLTHKRCENCLSKGQDWQEVNAILTTPASAGVNESQLKDKSLHAGPKRSALSANSARLSIQLW